jgi:hypothetical protein
MIRFCLLALGVSWAGWNPFAAGEVGLLPFTVPWEVPLLAQFGPTIAAFALGTRSDGRRGGPSSVTVSDTVTNSKKNGPAVTIDRTVS